MSKLQAPDKEPTVRFTVDMSESLHHRLSMLAACDGAQESRYRADAAGGWIEGNGRVKAIVLARLTRVVGRESSRPCNSNRSPVKLLG